MGTIIKIVSISAGIFVLSWYLFRVRQGKVSLGLIECIEAFLLGYGIVAGVVLLICTFYPPLFSYLDDQHIYYAVAGISLLYIGYSGVSQILGFTKKKQETKEKKLG
jgi:hypothetical protein